MISRSIIALTAMLSLSSIVAPAYAGNFIRAEGELAVAIDFSTLTLTPIGDYCLLQVDGELKLTGTLVGLASGTTRALVLASCPEVGANPPGTFEDRFRSDLVFAGVVGEDQKPVIADLTYRGVTHVGGDIKARFRFTNGLQGRMKVEATVAKGGEYRGFVAVID